MYLITPVIHKIKQDIQTEAEIVLFMQAVEFT